MNSDIFNQVSLIFNGKEIDFYVETEPRSNGNHWWLRVYCPDAEIIRETCGLNREPYFSFHLTLGKANEKNIEHSEYILRQCKFFNLLSSEERKPIEYHEILNF
jgi:hypothetical protein